MSSYSSNNKEVCVDDAEQRNEVAEDGVNKDVASAEPVLVQVVSAAGGHVALGHVPGHHKCEEMFSRWNKRYYLFQPKRGAIVQSPECTQMNRILTIDPLVVKGVPAMP